MQRVERTPVMVKDCECFCKINVCFWHLVIQVVRLHQNTVEFNSLSMHGMNNLKCLNCGLLCEVVVFLFKVDLA